MLHRFSFSSTSPPPPQECSLAPRILFCSCLWCLVQCSAVQVLLPTANCSLPTANRHQLAGLDVLRIRLSGTALSVPNGLVPEGTGGQTNALYFGIALWHDNRGRHVLQQARLDYTSLHLATASANCKVACNRVCLCNLVIIKPNRACNSQLAGAGP